MQPAPDLTQAKTKILAYSSIVSGCLAFLMLANPPMELLLGAAALILALLSRSNNGRKFTSTSVVGLALGGVNILLSLFIFVNFIAAIRIMDSPESVAEMIDDPAKAQEFRDLVSYYRSLLSGGSE